METNIFDNKKGIFITATGTDAGKTYVSGLIVKYLREKNVNAGYYKPALSGAYVKNGRLVPGDAEYVCRVSDLPRSPESLVSYIFEPAVSPHLAAEIEQDRIHKNCHYIRHKNKTPYIEKNVILQHFNKLSEEYDFLVVEGCGGILCPLKTPNTSLPNKLQSNSELLMLPDIIKMLGLDIIIVADAGLGTINLVLLTVAYARQENISIAGIILNHFDGNNFLHKDNKKQIEFLTNLPVLDCIPTLHSK